jgi:hypothetical protein
MPPQGGRDADLSAFGTDDREDLPDDATVCVVAAVDYTFEQCANGFYPCPREYPRTERAFDVMGFYRTAPTSAVTHYARVTDRFEDDGTWMGETRYEKLIGQFSDAETAMVFELEELRPLDVPVKNDEHGTNGVRGALYCTLGELREARTLSELEG